VKVTVVPMGVRLYPRLVAVKGDSGWYVLPVSSEQHERHVRTNLKNFYPVGNYETALRVLRLRTRQLRESYGRVYRVAATEVKG